MQGLQDFQNTSLVNSDNFQSTEDYMAFKYAKELSNQGQQREILLHEEANPNQQDQEISCIQNEDNSVTLSLSFIQEEQKKLLLSESIQWEKILSQYGNLFKNGANGKNYRQMCKFEDIINHHNNLIIHKGFDSVISRGYNVVIKDWIVLKRQYIKIKQIKEAVNEYLIHDEIYRQYPDVFLKLLQPVYIESYKQEQLEFTSQLEEGIVNLYDYSQQHKIQDLEFQLIFQQIYEQIQLLHKRNIAHRDIKPQNIIFVKNKGWLLCDFGDSLKYESVQGIYNIRGTYSFIQPQLQILAKIEGISTKQNLHHNDLYALAITLLVIKFQIKNSDEITQYIAMNKDPIIEELLKQNNDVDKLITPNEVKFIQPQFDKYNQQQLTSQNSNSIEYYQGLVDVLCCKNNLFPQLPQEIIRDILNQIDYKLQLKDSECFSFNITCIMQINHYAKELKNLLPLTLFRSSRFWKIFIKLASRENQKLRQQSLKKLIGQLHSLGYIELTLNLAKLFLQIDYDFTVHIIVITLLKYLQQDEEAHYEYNQLLNNREYLYMNESEQLKFIHLVMYEFPDHQQSSDRIYIEKYFDRLLYLSHLIMQKNADEQLIINQYFQDLHKMINMRKTEEHVLGEYQQLRFQSLNFQINFIRQAIKSMKYCASIIYMQKFLFLKSEDLILLGNRTKLKKLIKRMNQNLLISSESSTQMQVLTSLKFIVLLKSKINKKNRDQKLMNQLLQIVMKLDTIKFQFYRHVILEEISNQLIYEQDSQRNALKYFKLFICIYKRQYYTFIKNYRLQYFITIAFEFFNITLNRKRYLETTNNEKGKFWHDNEPNTTQRLIHQKTCNTSNKQFLFQQYLQRNN